MKLQMKQILNFPSFYEIVKNQKLSMKTAYRLHKLSTSINEELQFYYEKFQEIIQRYGEKNEAGQFVITNDGSGIKLVPGTEEKCLNEIKELQEIDISLPDIVFSIEEFSGIELTATEIEAGLPFLID